MRVLDNQVIRSDSKGDGHFGASRTDHIHEGVDYEVSKGQKIYAPFSGEITRYGYPYYGDTKYRYIEITGEEFVVRIMYAELDNAHYVGKSVGKSWFIGIAQDVSEKYGSEMKPHVHVELRRRDNGELLNPADYFEEGKKKV